MTRVLALIFMIFGFAAHSADVVVRSGEHGEFTRIFLAAPQETEWQVTQVDRGYRIELPSGIQADLTGAFDRIGQTRVGSIVEDEDGLDIILSCDCGKRSFLVAQQGLVIDVSEDFPRETELPLGVEDTLQTSQIDMHSHLPLGELDWKLHRARHPEVRVGLPFDIASNEHDLPLEIGQSPASQLLVEIATAATNGLLAPAKRIDDTATITPKQALASAAAQIELARDAHNQLVNVGSPQVGQPVCESEHDYSVAQWGDPDRIHAAISEARRRLIDEAGGVDREWLRKLILAHIYAGQGLEAQAILAADDMIEDNTVLKAIATLIGVNASSLDLELAARGLAETGCNASLAMWRTLAGSRDQNDQANSVLSEFSSLPEHLRMSLGPVLIEAYVRMDDLVSARLARSALERLGTTPSDELREVYAQIHEEHGEHGAAEEIYEDILKAAEAGAPEAAVKLVDMVSAREGIISDDTTDLIDALSFEYQGTEEGRQLNFASVQGQVLQGDVLAAIDAIQRRDFNEFDISELEELLFQYLNENMGSQELVDLYVSDPQYFLTNTQSEAIRSLLGAALAETGFSQQAQKLGASGDAKSIPRNPTFPAPEVSQNVTAEETTDPSALPENLVAQGESVLSQSKSSREDIMSLLSQVR